MFACNCNCYNLANKDAFNIRFFFVQSFAVTQPMFGVMMATMYSAYVTLCRMPCDSGRQCDSCACAFHFSLKCRDIGSTTATRRQVMCGGRYLSPAGAGERRGREGCGGWGGHVIERNDWRLICKSGKESDCPAPLSSQAGFARRLRLTGTSTMQGAV